MELNAKHKDMTEEESLKNIKKLHKKYPDMIMNPTKWEKLRNKELIGSGLSLWD